MLRKIILLILLICTTGILHSQDEIIQIRLANTDNRRSETVSGTLVEVNFSNWFLIVRSAEGKSEKIDFVEIRLTDLHLFRILQRLAGDNPEHLFESAKVLKFLEKPESGGRFFRAALEAGFNNDSEIKKFNAEILELEAQDLIKNIKTKISQGDISESRKILNKMNSTKYAETIAYQQVDELKSLIDRTEQNIKKPENVVQRDVVAIFTTALDKLDAMLGEGHILMAERQNFGATQKWREAINHIESRNGVLAELSRLETTMQNQAELKELLNLKNRAYKILTALYKSMIAFYLSIDSFPGAREYLEKAVKIAPLDREILTFWYIYDEYKPLIIPTRPTIEPDKDKDK